MHTLAFETADALNLLYLLAAVLFIVGLKMLSKVKTAVRGNQVSAAGMLLAACVTLYLVIAKNYNGFEGIAWGAIAVIFGAVLIGAIAGLLLALKVPMTGMPQMVALLNGFGGLASLLVACGDYLIRSQSDVPRPATEAAAIGLATLVGGVTFSGSLVAFAKLQGIMTGRPILFTAQKAVNGLMLLASFALIITLAVSPNTGSALGVLAVLALIIGVITVIAIGGADMPVVISLLNSYSGIAAAMAGFVLGNQALIITGALVGASGIILTHIMCKGMNRSLANVLFGGVGFEEAPSFKGKPVAGSVREMSTEDVAIQLDAARLVVVVPGYGMAVAQAQHIVAELGETLGQRGVTVKYAIHPVAGRMPGHMNVLLAEADVPYEQLFDLDGINPEFEQTDVSLVIGANDVTNPAARTATDSPIYGMPILDVDKSRSVVVIKRSLNPGFAGVDNELYYAPNCGMLFGDAKKVVHALVTELESS